MKKRLKNLSAPHSHRDSLNLVLNIIPILSPTYAALFF